MENGCFSPHGPSDTKYVVPGTLSVGSVVSGVAQGTPANTDPRKSQMGEAHRTRYGAGTRASVPSSTPLLSTLTSPVWSSEPHSSGRSGGSVTGAGLIKLLVLGDEVRLQPLPHPWPWVGARVQGAYEEQRGPPVPVAPEIPGVLGALRQEQGRGGSIWHVRAPGRPRGSPPASAVPGSSFR